MEIPELFKADVPPVFLTTLHHAIRDAYSTAKETVDRQGIGPDERYNVMPWTRRGHVESRLRDAAATCGIRVTTEKTGFWRHVVLTCGRFRLTQTTSIDSETPLRKAEYKCRYAAEQKLLPGLEDFQPTFDHLAPHLYAVVMHRAGVLADEPDFMAIRFPTQDLSGFHPGEIDLSLYAGLPSGETATPAEEIIETAIPRLKRKKKTGNG